MQEYLNLFVAGPAGVLAGLGALAGYYAATHQNRLTASSFVADWLRDLLRKRRAIVSGQWVFPNPKTGKPYIACREAWVTARTKANLGGLRMHDLRHTYASMMLEAGADIVDVQQALGHTQLKTTAVYLHLREARKRVNADAASMATGLFA